MTRSPKEEKRRRRSGKTRRVDPDLKAMRRQPSQKTKTRTPRAERNPRRTRRRSASERRRTTIQFHLKGQT
ncbi:hypothetical protein M406DRAFT_294344 [Cryphonectria parasitica EP155]|uniref:Uncharacterized protein n=1 Tax=Cryphonectria parasitica (strain ATCC 38755 / EP155) TaxID=660469 RepID=A0A9P5CM85_CRYP1|nr:uncharacterized protein M406DRAFT_294344 [Cryphonectria parasitica EP155]KAF3762605.1 hypothetical protein M406DRAFT_294344 [Cryphonectria parasitica EP155]